MSNEKVEVDEWTKTIDSIIICFPKVLSSLVVSFLFPRYTFDSNLLPCNTHATDHLPIDPCTFIHVAPTKLTVLQFSQPYIFVSLQQKIENGNLEIFFENSANSCIFSLVENSIYKSFVGRPYAFNIPSCHSWKLPVGRYLFIMTNDDSDKRDGITIRIIRLSQDNEVMELSISKYPHLNKRLLNCHTILFGLGFYPQSVSLLPYPRDFDPIWQKIINCPSMRSPYHFDMATNSDDKVICQTCANYEYFLAQKR
jgi:hypothetical protein